MDVDFSEIGQHFALQENGRLDNAIAQVLWPFRGKSLSRITLVLLLAMLCSAAYLPALNNGFISDDYVTLQRVSTWEHDFMYIFTIVPECFRMTTHLLFALFKRAFGYESQFYYVFAILLHLSNCVLVWKVVALLSGKPEDSATPVLSAILFAVFQNPQEAIMWLSGMNELFLGFFLISALLLWHRNRFLWSASFYLMALFSKESAVVFLLLLPLTEWYVTRMFAFRRQHVYLAVPTLVFCAVFVVTFPNNQMVNAGFYGLGWNAAWVLIKSLHRLMFPWLYLGAIALYLLRRRLPPLAAGAGFVWMAMTLLPYIFLTYQDHVPSRQEYLASVGLAWALSEILELIDSSVWQHSLLIAFIVVNIGYVWLVKDAQFLRRAAPTTRLIEQLRMRQPQDVIISSFPLNPWIAKETAWLAEGWRPEMILIEPLAKDCMGCLNLRWNPGLERYDVIKGRSIP